MKKKVIIGGFLLLILITVIATVAAATASYNYDMDPNNGVDLLEGFGAIIVMIVGGFVVLYELDLFYTVYYFFIKPKTITRTLLNVFSNFSLVLIFIYTHLSNIFMELRKYETTPGFLFFIYVLLRLVYLFTSTAVNITEDPEPESF
jgi:hypothetical protein